MFVQRRRAPRCVSSKTKSKTSAWSEAARGGRSYCSCSCCCCCLECRLQLWQSIIKFINAETVCVNSNLQLRHQGLNLIDVSTNYIMSVCVFIWCWCTKNVCVGYIYSIFHSEARKEREREKKKGMRARKINLIFFLCVIQFDSHNSQKTDLICVNSYFLNKK